MVKRYFLICLLAFSQTVFCANYTNIADGLFSTAANWVGGVAPTLSGDTWVITNNTTVYYDYDNSAAIFGWSNSVVNGTLAFTNGQAAGVACHLKLSGNISGPGYLLFGTVANPITNLTGAWPALTLQFTNTGQITMTNHGKILWYGTTNGFLDYTTNTAETGSSNLQFTANVTNLESNDVVYVANTLTAGLAGSYHVVYQVSGNTVTLFNAITGSAATVTNTWWGKVMSGIIPTNYRTNGTLVCKLSRPIVYFQPIQITTTGAFNGSGTNTIQGVRFNNLGRGTLNTLNKWTVRSCTFTANTSGGGAYGGSGHSFQNCVFTANASGGGANYGSQTFINCAFTNQSVPIIAYYPNETTIWDTNGYSFVTAVTTAAYCRAPYDVLLYNGTNWSSDAGMVTSTNTASPISTISFAHIPTRTNAPTSVFIDIGVKPSTDRTVNVWTWNTNGVWWYYQATPVGGKPLNPTTIPYSTTGWTQTPVTITNSLTSAFAYRLWVCCQTTNTLPIVYSWIDVPTDYTVTKQ